MADLNLFASIITDLDLNALAKRFDAQLISQLSDEELCLESDSVKLNIVASGPNEFLMRGTLDNVGEFKQQVVSALRGVLLQVHIDIFEEDGRLIERITEPGA